MGKGRGLCSLRQRGHRGGVWGRNAKKARLQVSTPWHVAGEELPCTAAPDATKLPCTPASLSFATFIPESFHWFRLRGPSLPAAASSVPAVQWDEQPNPCGAVRADKAAPFSSGGKAGGRSLPPNQVSCLQNRRTKLESRGHNPIHPALQEQGSIFLRQTLLRPGEHRRRSRARSSASLRGRSRREG